MSGRARSADLARAARGAGDSLRSGQLRGILILGGGVMQLPAVRIARDKGWRVYVAALSIEASVRELADRCLEVDVSDCRAVEKVAHALMRRQGLHGVFTAGTDFSTTVAWVAERLGLPGIPYDAALDATDKARMRSRLKEHGLAVPAFATLPSGGPAARPPGLDFPLVVKPADSMGARGVRRVDTDGQLQEALSAAWSQSRGGQAVVEEFIEGPELSLDAVLRGDQVTICGVADRHIRFEPYFVEMGHTLPSALPRRLLAEAEVVFTQGIRALGLRLGAAKGDIKLTPHGAVIGEIAARLSGGYMSGWTYPLASGVEATAAALNLAVGLPPGDMTPIRTHVAAERAFISIPGRVLDISGLEEARAQRAVREVFLRVQAGQDVQLPINNMGKCGNVIAAAATRKSAVAAAESAVRKILVRLVPAAESTDAFLTGRIQGGFSAFPDLGPELRRVLFGLPAMIGENPGPNRLLRIVAPRAVALETCLDWHGFTVEAALRAVCSATGAEVASTPGAGRVNLGGPFWRALLKGGVQAGVYLIDTLRAGGGPPGGVWSQLTGGK